jgi:hypothetical protein
MIITKDSGLTLEQEQSLSDANALNVKKEASNDDLTEEQKQWLTNDFWPAPNWLVQSKSKIKFRNYDSYFEYNLQTRYLELEGEFRNVFNNNYSSPELEKPTAGRIVSLLKTAKNALENEDVNLFNVADILDIVERYMIWLYPLYFVEQRIKYLSDKIISTRPAESAILNKVLSDCDKDLKLKLYRDVYDRVTGNINKENITNYINYGLQIERLEMLRTWGNIIFGIIILFAPFLLNFENKAIAGYRESSTLINLIPNFKVLAGWLLVITLAIFGGIGGFISGLLQIKNSKINLLKYKESLLKFQLKPLVGAITAALISVLLSWEILPDIKIASIGSFVFIAFLAGFSERYFLNLLTIDEKKEEKAVTEKTKESN